MDSTTDIMIWDGEIWVTDIKIGHYRYSITDESADIIGEFHELIPKLPRQVAIRMGYAFNEGSPILDGEAMFADIGQLRFNAMHESLIDSRYPAIAIRKSLFSLRISAESIITEKFADQNFQLLVRSMVDCGCNIMISGETGSGKTELLRFMAQWIRKNEAIITMEDTLEVYLKRLYPQKNVLSLKANDKHGFDRLLRSCLRQNPDWICVSETRGKEVIQLINAVGTGHRLISTLHTDSAQNIPYRMLDMAQLNDRDSERVFKQIHHNINIGIQLYYYNDSLGSHRQVSEICEFYLDQQNQPQAHLIYYYDYVQRNYQTDFIKSPLIKKRLIQRQCDVNHLKGVFI
ncbi:putative conjugal transfer protein [bioreactor metagenome]|uniref:Putative conjugal transfer protein n=1 Tax=bioreactor metagenome TaxID=1076179 RepID=A0A645BAZ6_9ZZZZ